MTSWNCYFIVLSVETSLPNTAVVLLEVRLLTKCKIRKGVCLISNMRFLASCAYQPVYTVYTLPSGPCLLVKPHISSLTAQI